MECDHHEKGEEKRNISYFGMFFMKKFQVSYLMKEPPSFPTFQVKARLYVNYVNFIAVRKYNFLASS